MSGFSIDSVNLGPKVTTPISGNTYSLNNLAFSHWLDNAGSSTKDGNIILAWLQDTPATSNQEVRTAETAVHTFSWDWDEER